MKKFTLEQAQAMLPLVDTLLLRARASYLKAERLEQKAADLRVRIFHSGGLAVDVVGAARDNAELKTQKAESADLKGELEAMGVLVKDLMSGIVDFPCNMAGETVLLCWKQGENRIGYWHGEDEGFSSRRRLEERSGKADAEGSETSKKDRLN